MSGTNQNGGLCRLTLADGTHLSQELVKLIYTAGCSSSTTGPTLGSTVAASFMVVLAGTLPILENRQVTLEVQTGTDTWVSLGRFRFQTPETGEEQTTVTAVDPMLAVLEAGYFPSSPAPTTALGVLRDLCSQSGLTLGSVTGLTDVPVSGELNGYTRREMAGYMAALLGRNGVIGPSGELELIWFAPSGAAIGPDDYYSGGFTRKDYDWTLSGLNVSTGDGEEDTLSVGSSGSTIDFSNPYMTQSQLNAIWSELQGFSYRPGEVTLLGNLSIRPGYQVTVTDRSGTSYSLAVMAVEHSYDGGWKTKLTAYGAAETDISANYKGPTTTALERLATELVSTKQLLADKANITDLEATTAQIGSLTADLAQVEQLIAQKAEVDDLEAANAHITDLSADLAQVEELVAGKADIDDLNAANASIGSLTADLANVETLLAGSAGVGNLQAIH